MLDLDLTSSQKEQVDLFVKEAFHYNKTHNLFVRDSVDAIYNKDIKDCWPALEHINKNEKVNFDMASIVDSDFGLVKAHLVWAGSIKVAF